MANAENGRTELPAEFESREEAGLFWDTHSSADYEAIMVPVTLEVDAPLDRFCVALARELAQKQRLEKRLNEMVSERARLQQN